MTLSPEALLLDQEELIAHTPQDEQIQAITHQTEASKVSTIKINPNQAIETLKQKTGQKIITLDFGGSGIKAAVWQIDDKGSLAPISEIAKQPGSEGNGSLAFAQEFVAKHDNLPIGISTAGVVEDAKLINTPLIFLHQDLHQHSYNFATALNRSENKTTVNNDGGAGLFKAVISAHQANPNVKAVIYGINGGGMNTGIWVNNQCYALEAGHTPLKPGLISPNDQNHVTSCDMPGSTEPCLENVASSGRGITRLYNSYGKHQMLSGELLSHFMQAGDVLASRLYNQSAYVMAHVLIGTAKGFNLDPSTQADQIAYALHGDCFEVPGYYEKVVQYMEDFLNSNVQSFCTKGISPNACLEGAAIATALTAKS